MVPMSSTAPSSTPTKSAPSLAPSATKPVSTIFWLKDESLTDLDNLPEPDDLAEEIIENLEAGLNSFREVLAGLEAQ